MALIDGARLLADPQIGDMDAITRSELKHVGPRLSKVLVLGELPQCIGGEAVRMGDARQAVARANYNFFGHRSMISHRLLCLHPRSEDELDSGGRVGNT